MHQASARRFFTATVVTNQDLGGRCKHLVLALPEPAGIMEVEPGQFVMLRGPWGHHPMLPRAFSVLDIAAGQMEILIKVVGRGTALLAALPSGAPVTVLGPLGSGFPPTAPDVVDLLLGGGSGIPPLHLQAKRAAAQGTGGQVELIYGGRSRSDLVLLPRLEALGVPVFPCTEDGSHGVSGQVTDVLKSRLAAHQGAVRVLACGPRPMLRAVGVVCAERGVPCLVSLETEMACGLGICRGCTVPRARAEGYLCTCLEGPVVNAEEVIL